ncbi:M48 family metalloprotease [Marinospirillum insulare]|uniref:Peptidase M48 domain-containing protein n=1 Tax=Marinospirillum insulare TaxID=217169 RepID=A0ABQ5ZY04_9GAMM|nr:M48 family metalloprotease [Marinospirillum insulare]GLR63958.1 hypothetical protein GCM10007878_13960 [Marinospirillum insulare]
MLALIASPLLVIIATAFFVSVTVLIYSPVIVPLFFLLDWLYASGYIPWDQWRILYTVLFLYVSFILLHGIADNLFGFTYRQISQDDNIEEATPDNENLAWLYNAFKQVKEQFPSEKKARVFYCSEGQVNAIAFRDLRHKGVMIYGGLLKKIIDKNTEDASFLAIKGILAHELSHLTNWDFLSMQYRQALAKQFAFHMKIRDQVYATLHQVLPLILIVGLFVRWAMVILYNLSSVVINGIISIYKRLDAAISRSIEFRCDRQAAKAVGWQSIFLGLNSLPINSRSTLFDSHPDGVSRLLYVHRRGGEKSSQQHISGSIVARITALMLYPILFLLAWWLGEVAEVLPQGYFLPVYQLLLVYLHAVPGFTFVTEFLISTWDYLVGSVAFILNWGQQDSSYLWLWTQVQSMSIWGLALSFHDNLLSNVYRLYEIFIVHINNWTNWSLSSNNFFIKWLPFTSTILLELVMVRLLLNSLMLIKKILASINEKFFLIRFTIATRVFRKKSAPELDDLLITAFNERNYSAILRLVRKGAHPARVKLTTGHTLSQHLKSNGDPLASSIARLMPKE